MTRMSDAEIGAAVRRSRKGRRIKPRRQLNSEDRGENRYMESDADFLINNREVAADILEALLDARKEVAAT